MSVLYFQISAIKKTAIDGSVVKFFDPFQGFVELTRFVLVPVWRWEVIEFIIIYGGIYGIVKIL